MAALPDPADPDAFLLDRATPHPRVKDDAIDARESVYRVILAKGVGDGQFKLFTGSGFVIRAREDRCMILTCDHVLRAEGEAFDEEKDAIYVRKMCDTGDLRVRDFRAHLRYTDRLTDLALIEATGITEVHPLRLDLSDITLGRTAIAVGYCDVSDHEWTRTPTVSTGVTISYPYQSTEGERDRVLVDINCVGSSGMSGCPVVSHGGVLGLLCTGVIDTHTKRLVATQAIYTSTVLEVMKQWVHLPENDASTIDQVIEML